MLTRTLSLFFATVTLFLLSSNAISASGTNEFISRGGYALIRPQLVDFFGLRSVNIVQKRFCSSSFTKGRYMILPPIPQHLLENNRPVRPLKRIPLKGQMRYNAVDDLFYYEIDPLPKSQKAPSKSLSQEKAMTKRSPSRAFKKKGAQRNMERTDED